MMQLLVSTEWLAKHLYDANVRVVDVRWYLFEKDKTGKSEYLNGHIPGAVLADMDTDLSSHDRGGPGRHPMPHPHVFAEAMSRLGIDANTHVVAYDDRGGATAARLWFLLRYFGHDNVSLLDGGITQWNAEKRSLQQETPQIARGNFVAREPRTNMVADREAVQKLTHDPKALVIDVRVAERYEGKVEPIDPKPGHIPGAKNAPIGSNLRGNGDMRFLDVSALHARFDNLGLNQADQVVAYCGSGVNAAQAIFVLNLIGRTDAMLYEGSWSDWSRQDLPVATGPTP
jgi:thiosulfate/3-mercaptopyruvate sulfurtransferase